jgi:hypothetical protein
MRSGPARYPRVGAGDGERAYVRVPQLLIARLRCPSLVFCHLTFLPARSGESDDARSISQESGQPWASDDGAQQAHARCCSLIGWWAYLALHACSRANNQPADWYDVRGCFMCNRQITRQEFTDVIALPQINLDQVRPCSKLFSPTP